MGGEGGKERNKEVAKVCEIKPTQLLSDFGQSPHREIAGALSFCHHQDTK